jgi:hypothetical protein
VKPRWGLRGGDWASPSLPEQPGPGAAAGSVCELDQTRGIIIEQQFRPADAQGRLAASWTANCLVAPRYLSARCFIVAPATSQHRLGWPPDEAETCSTLWSFDLWGVWYILRVVLHNTMKKAWRLSRVPGCGRGDGPPTSGGIVAENPPTVKAKVSRMVGGCFLFEARRGVDDLAKSVRRKEE